MCTRGIYPVYDTAFKLIFGQENSRDLLLDFLNDLLEGEKKIKELHFFTKKEEECRTNQDLWLYTLKNMKTLKEIPFKEQKPIFKKLEEIADLASLSKEERRLYDADVRAYRDRLAELGTARRDGEKIGEKRGEKRGEKIRNLR